MPSTRRLIAAACAASLLCLGLVSDLQAGKQLRWKFNKGDKFAVQSDQKMSQVLKFGNESMEIPQTISMYMTWVVDDVDAEGTASVTQTIDRVVMSMQAPGQGEVKYDSSVEGGGGGLGAMVAGMFKPMIGVKFTQKMSSRGKVFDVNIPDSALTGLTSNPITAQVVSKESMQDLTGKAALEFPEELDKGDSWTNTVDAKTPAGKLVISTTYTYDGEELRDNVTLDKISTSIKVDGNAMIKEHQGTGIAYFDARAGRLVEMTTHQSQKLSALGQNIDQVIDTTITIKPAGK